MLGFLLTERELVKLLWFRGAIICLEILGWLWLYSGWELKEFTSFEFIMILASCACVTGATLLKDYDNATRCYRFPRELAAVTAIPSFLCMVFYTVG